MASTYWQGAVEGRLASDLRGIGVVWYRDVLRFWRDKTRILTSLVQPLLFLFIFGGGLSPIMSGVGSGPSLMPGAGGFDYVKFMFPGIISMAVLMSSLMSGISIVWDREFGFLKEVLVAPVSRTAVTIGKALGGSTIGMVQGTIMLIFAPLAGIGLSVPLMLKLWPLMFLGAFALTSMGILIAGRMKSMEGFQMVINFLMMPMLFLSGALFPVQGLPSWMDVLVKINPLTYAVDAIRQVVFESVTLPAAVMAVMDRIGIRVVLFGHTVTVLEDIAIVGVFAAVMVVLAVRALSAQD